MFELYTEGARRAIFFGRYESSGFGSPYIETEHLLLGILREDKGLTNRLLQTYAALESIRKQISEHAPVREKISTSVDLPLSNECKRVLAYAAEESMRLKHPHIGCEHLLLGILREEDCFAAHLLKERGLTLLAVREQLAREVPATPKSTGETGVEGTQPAGATEPRLPASAFLHLVAEDGSALADIRWQRQQLPRIGEVIRIRRQGLNAHYRILDIAWDVFEAGIPSIQQVKVVVTVRPENSPSPTA